MGTHENERKETLSISEILTQIGEFGLYQKLIDAAFCLIFLFISFPILIMFFSTLAPSWRCTGNNTICSSRFIGTQPSFNTARCKLPPNSWEYTEPKGFSMVTTFNICDEWLLDLLQSIHFVGWGVGATVLGWAGDIYGRKALIFPSCGIIWLLGLVIAFVENIYAIVVFRFLIGFFIPGVMVPAIVLISEIVGNKKRPLATQLPFFFVPIGYIMLAVKSYFLQNWKHLTIMCTVPYVFVFAFFFLIPKSPKWLHSQGQTDEAMQGLQKMARWNKNYLADNVVILKETHPSDPLLGKGSSWTSDMIFKTWVQSCLWFVVTMSIFGLQMAAKELQGSMYTNFILLSLISFPAIVSTIVATNYFGRKKTVISALLLESAACLAIVFIPARKEFAVARVVLGITGKFFASITLQSLYVWSSEIFPTNVRSKGMGIVEIMARFGAACAPWVVKGLSPIGLNLPFIVMGVPTLIGAALGFWLPETKNNEDEVK